MTIFKMRVSRTQWAVGHGFFHSGLIESGGKPVTYVYDCGATLANSNNLDREIDEFICQLRSCWKNCRCPLCYPLRYPQWYRQRYNWRCSRRYSSLVDIMYISHFDYDHVSGIPKLAGKV